MKRVEEFQKTEKLIEEYKKFGNKISEYEGKIDENKEENAAKVNKLEGQLEINNKKDRNNNPIFLLFQVFHHI